jgi:hypothetical protein
VKTDTEPTNATTAVSEDRWQVLADTAYALDDESLDAEVEHLARALKAFPEPAKSYQDYAVNSLLARLLRNRQNESERRSRAMPRRSEPGKGERVIIHVLGRADEHADCMVGQFGEISAGCGPMLGEDFAVTGWPVVVKAKQTVSNKDLVQHLRDLAKSIKKFGTGSPADRTGSLKELCGEVDEENPF